MSTPFADIALRRMHNQRVGALRCDSPADVVARLGAIQAQDYHQAMWAIGARTTDAELPDVERAIEERRIVLTWAMRGTIHAVPAADAAWMLRLATPRVLAASVRRAQELGLDRDVMVRCEALIRGALEGGRRLARPDLMRLLEEAGIAVGNQRGYQILWRLGQAGVICQGPLDGKQQSFALLDEWVPRPARFDGDEALAELARRYFTGHGPATDRDFAWWSGLTLTDARRGRDAASPALRAEQADGETYWSADEAGPGPGELPDGVYLLPGFDELYLGYASRGAFVAPEHEPLLVPGGNGVYKPFVAFAGRIAGVWQRTIAKRGIDVEVAPFGSAGIPDEPLSEAANRYARFQRQPLLRIQQSPRD